MERLSSSATNFWKIVFPAIWLPGFGVGAVAAVIAALTHKENANIYPLFVILFPAGWLLGLVLSCWLCFPLKHVWLTPAGLHVMEFGRKLEIPFSEIESVTWLAVNPEMITVSLKSRTAFGRKIRFMPPTRFDRLSPHPTYTRLRAIALSNRRT